MIRFSAVLFSFEAAFDGPAEGGTGLINIFISVIEGVFVPLCMALLALQRPPFYGRVLRNKMLIVDVHYLVYSKSFFLPCKRSSDTENTIP